MKGFRVAEEGGAESHARSGGERLFLSVGGVRLVTIAVGTKCGRVGGA